MKNIMSEEPDIVILRFARVVFGVSFSPFLLNAAIRHHLNKYLETQPTLVEKIQESIKFWIIKGRRLNHWKLHSGSLVKIN